ncbi:hypothetical protein BDN70DRAFT_717847 [Pholiota conissans]|uniref:F-box domain-containing protein n=1 Tax=Pholiota conissans TaxID=109636 RepID=A0A9P5Z287_9AGAR|nr:hypothetical protein BDN70DRAFT_717847 [Pholiota conissans]
MATLVQSSFDPVRRRTLPPELMSLIFDCLKVDRDWATLGACSLISHQYLRPARKILFHCITLKMRGSPNPILIHDVARRIQGLCDTMKRDPDIVKDIKRFEVLDSYPVYESQWITQQPTLPRLIKKLAHVQECTFGCEVGYLQWRLLTPSLAASLERLFSQPSLKSLTLCNIGGIPSIVMGTAARYLYLNNITTDLYPCPYPDSQLCYLNVRTVSLANTESAWELMKAHSKNLKLIKWRCWEDPQATDGVSFPGRIDLGKLPALKKLCVRLSYGKIGRDLSGFCDMLEAATCPTPLTIVELSILFPQHNFPSDITELRGYDTIWKRLAVALLRPQYNALRRVTMNLTVHEKMRTWNGQKENSVAEFRKQMHHSLGSLLNVSTFHFKFKVHVFNQM